MRWGSPWSSGWGSPDNHFIYTIPDLSGMAASGNTYLPLSFKLRPGLDGAYAGIYRNGQFVRNAFVPVNAAYNGIVDIPWGSLSLSVMPLRIGHLGDPSYSDEKVVRVYEGTENGRVTLQFTFTPKVFIPPLSDGGYTSNWSLSGLQQGINTGLVQGHPSWGRLAVTLSVLGGSCTVTLLSSGTVVASGSAAIGGSPFTVSLTAQNNSGLSGTVTVSNTVTNVTNGVLDIRWPASVQILRDTFDPPTTVRDTVTFKGTNTVRWTESLDLPSGTYYYRTQPVSDTGITGTQSASVSIATIARPKPPTSLAYSSGNASATVLSFTPSVTGGATYRAYLSTAVGGVMSLNDIKATAGAGANSITLPAITGYPGIAYVIVRAVASGVEERNLNILALEYDASGNFVPARPNAPGIQLESLAITSGRTISVKGIYNSDHQAAAATSLQLFSRTPSGSYNFASPIGSGGTLTASGVKGIQTGTITYTFPADGYYYLTMLAVTAGGTQSAPAQEVLILVSNDQLPAATGVVAQLSRS
jgi:hypothetical protein